MKKEHLTELEYWKLKSIAGELSSLVSEKKYIESESQKLAARRQELEKSFRQKQGEKETIIQEVFKRLNIENKEGAKFKISLTNDPKDAIIEYKEDE